MTPSEWRALVGGNVERRRLDYLDGASVATAADLAGVSPSLWRNVESGQQGRDGRTTTANPRPDKRALICRALGWTTDSIDRMARGESPVEEDATPPIDRMAMFRDQLRDLMQEVQGIARKVDEIDSVVASVQRTVKNVEATNDSVQATIPLVVEYLQKPKR